MDTFATSELRPADSLHKLAAGYRSLHQLALDIELERHLEGLKAALRSDQHFAAEIAGYFTVFVIFGAQIVAHADARANGLAASVALHGEPVRADIAALTRGGHEGGEFFDQIHG